jgi:hypothetical protein
MREYSPGLIALLKGIVYSQQKIVWENVLQYQAEIKKYFAAVGLDLYLDVSEGYAYLKQKELEEEMELPRLSEKRQLNFHISLLCLVLRKYLLEQDAQGGAARTIISYQEIVSRMKLFLPSAPDEAKQEDKISGTINRVIEIGFLRKLDDNSNNYEVHRIIKGFIDADVIDSTLRKLERYAKEKNPAD